MDTNGVNKKTQAIMQDPNLELLKNPESRSLLVPRIGTLSSLQSVLRGENWGNWFITWMFRWYFKNQKNVLLSLSGFDVEEVRLYDKECPCLMEVQGRQIYE